MAASRAYEANVTALNVAKSMALKALEIGKMEEKGRRMKKRRPGVVKYLRGYDNPCPDLFLV